MEHIRLACGISRGGLYHHFGNKRAILDALVEAEVSRLVLDFEAASGPPIAAVLTLGSSHLGGATGVLAHLSKPEERQDYLSSLDTAVFNLLSPVLCRRLASCVEDGVAPGHVAELFLTINSHINRREIMGDWDRREAAAFAATALLSLEPLLRKPTGLAPIIERLGVVAERG